MQIKKYIPNAITCGNLFCGSLAVIRTMEGDLVWAAYLVGIAVLLDFLDGFMARLLGVSSAIGKDLDSLADMVTFGLVPALVMFKLIDLSYIVAFTKTLTGVAQHGEGLWGTYRQNNLIKYWGLAIAVFSALRLAKFNNDTRQTDAFIGLPTPANAIFICSFPLIINQLGLDLSDVNDLIDKSETFADAGNRVGAVTVFVLSSPLLLAGISVCMSALLVAEVPLLALKFKNFGWAGNQMRYLLVGLSLLLVLLFKLVALPFMVVCYLLLSIVNNIFLKTKV